ncbi:MAG: AAA family ATPase [Nitrospirae bacterium]|nr:AAA family ATPase [Nitrospirota bacterium]
MYNDYFGLKETPFSIAPDPRYLYMSEQHREALAHLIYGFNSDGGFVLLTGEVGTGKTTVCRCLLEQIPNDSSIAFIINPRLSVDELLATICDEFGIKYPERNISTKVFVDLLNAYLLDAHAKGRKAVLIIDEAQNLSANVLEELRLLTNLETNQRKLLQIILLGQPELRKKLSKPELRQLSQRIIARYHLGPLSRKDVSAYVTHRLAIAGMSNEIFPPSTIRKIYSLSGGVPRLINVLCDRALLGTFVQKERKVKKSTLKKAAGEVFEKPGVIKQYKNALALLLSVVIILIAAFFIFRQFNNNELKQADVYESPTPPALDKLHWHDNIPIDQSGSPAVLWLDKEISLLNGLTKETGFKKSFDGALLYEIQQFQPTDGLIPDGDAGFKSIIEINNTIGINEPGLTGIRENK